MNSLFWNVSYFWHRKTAKLRWYVAGAVKLQEVVCMMCAHGSFVCFKRNQICRWSEVGSALLIRTGPMQDYLLAALFLLWLQVQGRETIVNRKPERDCTSGFLKAPLSTCLWYKEVLWTCGALSKNIGGSMPHWLGTSMVLLKDRKMTKRSNIFKQTKLGKKNNTTPFSQLPEAALFALILSLHFISRPSNFWIQLERQVGVALVACVIGFSLPSSVAHVWFPGNVKLVLDTNWLQSVALEQGLGSYLIENITAPYVTRKWVGSSLYLI